METQRAAPGIIDAHCHIASEDYIPRSFVSGAVSNMVAALTAQGVGVTSEKVEGMYRKKLGDPLCDALVAEMAESGVSKSILLVPDFTYTLKDCRLTIEESFRGHREVLARHPGKFEVFGGVDPRWGQDGVTLFERSLAEFGFRGLKVYPPCGFSPSDPMMFPFYELCDTYRVPALVHTGPTSPALAFDTSDPFMLDEAARRFPRVNFILAHGGVNFMNESVMMCAYRPNIYLDTSGYQTTLCLNGGGALRAVVARRVNHKVLFGTDWPVFRLLGKQQSFVEPLMAEAGPLSETSERERELILYKNAERLLAEAVRSPPATH
ncbi:MAG: amidohydrolase family protein [Pyrinomonadaceae bacterium]